MAKNKYDYGDEMPQPGDMTAGEERARKLEERNNSIVAEFRRLKPEITRAYMQICALTEKSDAFSKSASELLESLNASFPVRLTDKDKAELQKELNGIAENTLSQIRKERERMTAEVNRNAGRISLTPAVFWFAAAMLLTLATFFVVVVFANVMIFHSEILTKIIWVYAGLILLSLAIVLFPFHPNKR